MQTRAKSLAIAAGAALVLGVVGAGVVLSGDGDGISTTATAPPAAATPEASSASSSSSEDPKPAAEPLALDGPKLPNVQASSTDGEIDFAKLEGPALIHVYASWCSVCRAEAPGLSAALKAAPGVRPIWIAVADSPPDSAAFAKSFGWPQGAMIDDQNRSVASKLGLTGQPNTILVDGEGRTQTIIGGSSQAQLTALLQGLTV
ncbi:MAG: redoxin domain-containing protein [Solirubrobacteraceae bacterium]|nr:redoxin domain-containing protein [Solirubrobacteraceae bacterium]